MTTTIDSTPEPTATTTSDQPLLTVRDLSVRFRAQRAPAGDGHRVIQAVDGVSFDLLRGQSLGVVGESGCGKTTLGRAILGLVRGARGVVRFENVDVLGAGGASMRRLRRDMQMVFQDPQGSLNPRMRVGSIVSEPLVIHRIGDGTQRRRRTESTLQRVGLRASDANRYPHELSGGQRQRVGIARAIILEPRLIVCDEPVSALDVSIQSQILNLFADLREQLGLTYLFISHDLAVVRHVCDRVAVMTGGRIVETGITDDVFERPEHDDTTRLLAATCAAPTRN